MYTFHLVLLFSLQLSYCFYILVFQSQYRSIMFRVEFGNIVLMGISYLGNLSILFLSHWNE